MFIEKLTKKDIIQFLKENVFTSFGEVKEIDKNFINIKENGLKLYNNYAQIPEVFKNIKKNDENEIFCGLKFEKIKENNNSLAFIFEAITFTYASWTNSYVLDSLPLIVEINDFKCEIYPFSYNLNSLNKDLIWQRFMYSKFGEEYITAFKKYLIEERVKELEKLSQKIEEKQNKNIEEIIK